ncbi:hypothetical protein [Flavobacterium algicola]|uniref:hypothetical protein n=1 Tax=Flavobacterium algicola TaxID=556529 RepID=UPI001EFD7B62|nr:hypothetical protein [Flavobacterium algicola]MCG9794002.1 hypothetical protein [Flavobacterium algicola]
MRTKLQLKLDHVSAYRENRLAMAQFVLENKNHFEELLSICFSPSNKNNHKACWILEFVAYEKLEWLVDYLDFFCRNLKNISNESAIRPLAKINQLLLQAHYSQSQTNILLAENQLQDCVEVNFDWLISDSKVATKAYAMRNLYILGRQYDWIHIELKTIIEKDYATHSAAYKAVAREILKKIK